MRITGQRTIDTVLRVQQENEYKAALQNCNSELKVLKTELDRVTSDFRNNANSMEALTAKGQTLSKMYDAQKEKVDLLLKSLQAAKSGQDQESQTLEDLRGKYEAAKKILQEYGEQFGENSEEYQKQKAAVDALRDSVIQHQAKLESASKAVNNYESQLNRASVELNKLSDEQAENNRLLQEASESSDHCAKSIDRYGKAVKKASEDTRDNVSAVDALASALVAGDIKEKIQDVTAAMMDCSKASQDYEIGLKKVMTIADPTIMSQQELHDSSLKLATDLRRDAEEVTAAAYDSLSAGVETGKVMGFVKDSAMLAKAGFTDLSTSVDVLTTIENAYNLSADETERISSILVRTQDLGKTTVDEMGKVIGRVIPSAAAYNVNLENIAASYAIMTAAGINAENSTTNLSTMLDELSDSGSQVSGVLEKQTSKSFADLMADGKSLGDVLDILGQSVEGDNVAFANLWSSSTAGKAAISLYDGSARKFNDTLHQMENSSGAVVKNYALMADTSETASKRVEVATKNLKIVIGDQLNPVLDKLRNAGAGVMEQASDVVAENPVLVASIAGVTSAVGLLATGVSALMAAKAAAKAMESLNITMMANPAVLITTAVVGLGAAIATYAAQTESASEKVERLTQASQVLLDTMASESESYQQSTADIEAAGQLVTDYTDRLQELENQSSLTQAEQMEYAMILDQIRQVMPGINLELDTQTGKLQGGTAALKANSDAWMENARMEAVTKRYKADIEALTNAEYERSKNQAKLSLLQQDRAEKEAQLKDVMDDLAAAYERENELTRENHSYLGQTNDKLDAARGHTAELEAQISPLNEELEALREEEEILQEAMGTSNEAIETASADVDAARIAYEEYSGAIQDTAETMSESGQETFNQLSEGSRQAQQAYLDMFSSAYETLNSQISLFQDLSGQAELTTEDMINRLLVQSEAFNAYAENITIAMQRGVDQGLVAKLSDGSAESMQLLAELVTGSDEQIAQLNAAFHKTEEAKVTVATSMAAVQSEFDSSMAGMTIRLNSHGYYAGQMTVEGLIAGIHAKQREFNDACAALADSGNAAYNTRNQIQSPSKRWKRSAEWDMEGLMIPYREAVPKLEQKSRELADSGYMAAIRVRQARLPELVASAASLQSEASHEADRSELLQLVEKTMSTGANRQMEKVIGLLETISQRCGIQIDGRKFASAVTRCQWDDERAGGY